MAITKIQSESMNLADTYAFTGTVTGASSPMTPAWHVYNDSNFSMSSSTETLITWSQEQQDTDNAFASNKFTVPSGAAGKYFVQAQICFVPNTGSTSTMQWCYMHINKNGSNITGSPRIDFRGNNGHGATVQTSQIVTLAVGDYLEVYGWVAATSPVALNGAGSTYFLGYKIIE